MKPLSQIIFWTYLLATIITGSLALPYMDELNYKLLLALPLLLSILTLNSKIKPQLNKTLFVLLGGVFVTMLISFCFSRHYANSLVHLVRLLAGLSLFAFSIWFGPEIRPQLPKVLLLLGVFYSLLFLFLNYQSQSFGWLMPQNGYNLFFPIYRLHNHLGDFLVLPILALIYNLRQEKKLLLSISWLIIFTLLAFYSYSRSSYTALTAGLLVLLITQIKYKLKPYQLILGLLFILGTGSFLLLTTKETAPSLSWLNAVENKLLLNGRDQYWGVSLMAIKDHFWFGIGSGNFIYAMARYNNIPFNWTESSLNIFLSIFSANGVFVFLAFVALLVWVIKNSNFGLSFILLIALLVNFQTDYTYEIVGMWLLFWLIMGLSIKNKPPLVNLSYHKLLLPGIIGLLLLSQLIITPILSQLKLYELAWLINPLNKANQEKLIVRQLFQQQYGLAKWQLKLYQRLYQADSINQYSSANYYLALEEPQQALSAFYQAYQWNPYTNLDLYRRIYTLEKSLNGKRAATRFLQSYETKVKQIKDKSYFSQKIKKDWKEFNKKLDKKPQF